MQRLEVSGAVRPIHRSLGVKRLIPIPPNFNIKNKLQRVVLGAERERFCEMQAGTSMVQKTAS